MLQWLMQNAATIIVSIVIAILTIAVIRKLIRDKREGKASCGCGCTNCAMQENCRERNKKSHF